MNIDLAALGRWSARRRSRPTRCSQAIETALLTAYRHTEGAQPHARVEIDRKTGEVAVLRAGDWTPTARSSASGTTPRTTSAGSPR